ncbi:MAG: hypothetical protein JJLCMIEE_01205 [Acidimicrobiales bacterium]|nr:MAG: hypothetical protein EDR02_06035 [Actinomycetota bacterium]MBV6508145.1 hypothetical protein [Acidimicrobiales bacterium]RIK08199.1 MAG: hypothetical protein DCC48_02155 [Acidobacteriota bacterium]
MVDNSPSPPDNRPAREVVSLPPELRAERLAALRWALANGRPANVDALNVVLAVASFEAGINGHPPRRWTNHRVLTFLWSSAVEWCRQQRVELPDTMGETMWSYFDYLRATGGFAPRSAPLAELRRVLVEVGGVTTKGRRRHPRHGRTRWATLHPLTA